MNILSYKSDIDKNEHFQHVFFLFLNNKRRCQKDIQFCVKNLKMKRKKDKFFLTFRSRDSNPRFSVIFPSLIWISGDKNKSALPSKIFPTLQSLITWYCVLFISCISLAYCIKWKAELETRNVKSWLKFLRLPKSEWVYTESPQRTLWFIIACNCKGNNFYLPPISCSGI